MSALLQFGPCPLCVGRQSLTGFLELLCEIDELFGVVNRFCCDSSLKLCANQLLVGEADLQNVIVLGDSASVLCDCDTLTGCQWLKIDIRS